MSQNTSRRPSRRRAPEPETGWLTAEERDAWIAVATIFLRVPGVIDAQLRHDSDLTMYEYLVLSALSQVEDRTLRMSELALVSNGSLSRLSNVVKGLEARRLVRRETCPEDGRFTNAVLTDDGFVQVVAAAPGHVDTVRRTVLEPLTKAQLRTLGAIGQRIPAAPPS